MLTFNDLVEYVQQAIKNLPREQQSIMASQIAAWKKQDSDLTQLAYQHPLFAKLMNAIEDQAKFGAKQ